MRPRRVAATVVGCLLIVLAVAGCAEGVERTADHYASVTVDTVTRYLRSDVGTPGLPADQQLAKVRSWLAAPSPDYTRAFTYPRLRVLSATDRRIEIVVYESARGEVFEGNNAAWGFACVRYTVDSSDQLQGESIACPNGVSRDPNR